ncbi:MAG: hypothetical protein M3Y56_15450 [Armatimonadota bacterium]|nr:hypothetical protein [Armatimonadota bacterium]
MSNIICAEITIVGKRALLWHAFGPDALPLEKQERTGVAGNDPEEWRKTVLMSSARQLYVDPSYIFGCLRDAAKYTRKGKGSIQTAVCATLQVEGDRVYLNRFLPEEPIPTDPELPVYMDVRSVRNPSTKGRNIRYRVAASAGWVLKFTILWDKTIVSRGEIESVCNDAGQLVGVGDGRSIGFGRFSVESFRVTEQRDATEEAAA